MQQKKALLVSEGVHFCGRKVSVSSVVQADELSALATGREVKMSVADLVTAA